MFAYCNNNPIIAADHSGEWLNIVIGAVVGGVISGVVAAVTSYAQTGQVDWGSVAINAAVGAVSGAIAATGASALVQAGASAIVSGAGNFAEQCHTKGIKNVNLGDVAVSAALGAGTSLLGSAVGELFSGNIKSVGEKLISEGRGRYFAGVIREMSGQSHSSLMRQGAKYIAQGSKMVNMANGVSSVVGSVVGGGVAFTYNAVKATLLGG